MRNIENYNKWLEKNKDKLRIKKTEWARSAKGRLSQRTYRHKSTKAMRSLYKASAKRRNLEFSISQKQFDKLIRLDCYYCGQKSDEGQINS